jgi:predicted MFS family arabinose efflux permease
MAGVAYSGGMPGLIALAIAMGIGRFAFTPILPMMQADAGLGVAQGGWLASANYVGYLVGALTAIKLQWRPGTVVRAALVLVALATAAMAFTGDAGAWIALRFAAGVASAWVLVFVSSWGFERPGTVFSGVGIGIAATGLICLVLMANGASSSAAWVALGLVALAASAALWPSFRDRVQATASAAPRPAWTPEAWRLVACYGAFGFGYIVPATFLPLMAKQAIDDPSLFGWSWPAFGAAAAASTMIAGRLRASAGDRAVWIAANLLMAAGVLFAMPWPAASASLSLALVILSAVLVGGTFMVITMAGIQEARRIAGTGARPLIAAMTTAFAVGQIAGPLVVAFAGGFTVALVLATALLLASAFFLRRSP